MRGSRLGFLTTALTAASSIGATAAWDNMLLVGSLAPKETPTRKSGGSSFKQNKRKAEKLKARKLHNRRK